MRSCLALLGVLAIAQADTLVAKAVILSNDAWEFGNGTILGTVTFSQDTSGSTVTVIGSLHGLAPVGAEHGFHVHALGDLQGGCGNASGHFNPFGKNHGAPNDTIRHVGDLGNVMADKNGSVVISMRDSVIQLVGVRSIVGRSVVVHQLRDDLGKGTGDKKAGSLKTGNAGKRIGCGVIGMASGHFPVSGAAGSVRQGWAYLALPLLIPAFRFA